MGSKFFVLLGVYWGVWVGLVKSRVVLRSDCQVVMTDLCYGHAFCIVSTTLCKSLYAPSLVHD